MDRRIFLALLVPLAGVAACSDSSDTASAASKPTQTGFPGEVTAGGGTSGEVLARAGRATEGSYAGGTPGIAGGSGGTAGGPATGGTAQESGRGPAGSVAPPKPTQNQK